MTHAQDKLIEKAHKKWGKKHRAFCLLCKKKTESTLRVSPYSVYLICTECQIARAPIEFVYMTYP